MERAIQRQYDAWLLTAPTTIVNDDSNDDAVRAWCDMFANELDLPHMALDTMRRSLMAHQHANESQPGTIMALQQLAVDAYRQTQQVQQVFRLLDPDGKGCIVLQDLQRTVHELELGKSNENDGEDWCEEALEEMMTFLGGSTGDDDDVSGILLLPDDLLRVAREVNL